MKRMFVEQNAARILTGRHYRGEVGRDGCQRAVKWAGMLYEAIIAEYGYTGEPIFGDGLDE